MDPTTPSPNGTNGPPSLPGPLPSVGSFLMRPTSSGTDMIDNFRFKKLPPVKKATNLENVIQCTNNGMSTPKFPAPASHPTKLTIEEPLQFTEGPIMNKLKLPVPAIKGRGPNSNSPAAHGPEEDAPSTPPATPRPPLTHGGRMDPPPIPHRPMENDGFGLMGPPKGPLLQPAPQIIPQKRRLQDTVSLGSPPSRQKISSSGLGAGLASVDVSRRAGRHITATVRSPKNGPMLKTDDGLRGRMLARQTRHDPLECLHLSPTPTVRPRPTAYKKNLVINEPVIVLDDDNETITEEDFVETINSVAHSRNNSKDNSGVKSTRRESRTSSGHSLLGSNIRKQMTPPVSNCGQYVNRSVCEPSVPIRAASFDGVNSNTTEGTTESTLAKAVAELTSQKQGLDRKLQQAKHALEEQTKRAELTTRKNEELTRNIDSYKKTVSHIQTRQLDLEKFLKGIGNDYNRLDKSHASLIRDLQTIIAEKAVAEAEIRDLEQKVSKSNSNYEHWRQARYEVQSLRIELATLADSKRFFSKEVEEKTNQLLEEKTKNQDLEMQLAEARRAHGALADVVEQVKLELLEGISALQNMFVQANTKNLSEQKEQYDRFTDVVNSIRVDKEKAETKLESLQFGLDTASKTVSSLNDASCLLYGEMRNVIHGTVTQLQADIESLKLELSEARKNEKLLAVLEAENGSMSTKVSSLEEQRQHYLEEIECLRSAESISNTRIESLENKIERLTEMSRDHPRLSDLQKTVEEFQQKTKDLEDSLKASNEALTLEQSKLASKAVEFDALYDELMEARETNDAALLQIKNFECEKSEYVERIDAEKKAERIEFEKAANSFRQKEMQRMQSQINSLEAQRSNLELMLKRYQNGTHEESAEQIQRLKEQSQNLWDKCDKQRMEIESYQSQLAEKDRVALGLQHQVAELSGLKERMEEQAKIIQHQKDMVRELDARLGETHQTAVYVEDASDMQISALQTENKALQQMLEKMKAQIDNEVQANQHLRRINQLLEAKGEVQKNDEKNEMQGDQIEDAHFLRNMVTELSQKVASLEDVNLRLKGQLSRTQQQTESLKHGAANQQSHDTIVAERVEPKQQNCVLSQDVTELREQMDLKDTEIARLKDLLDKMIQDANTAQTTITSILEIVPSTPDAATERRNAGEAELSVPATQFTDLFTSEETNESNINNDLVQEMQKIMESIIPPTNASDTQPKILSQGPTRENLNVVPQTLRMDLPTLSQAAESSVAEGMITPKKCSSTLSTPIRVEKSRRKKVVPPPATFSTSRKPPQAGYSSHEPDPSRAPDIPKRRESRKTYGGAGEKRRLSEAPQKGAPELTGTYQLPSDTGDEPGVLPSPKKTRARGGRKVGGRA